MSQLVASGGAAQKAPPGDASATYCMIDDPPSEAGADQMTVAPPAIGVAVAEPRAGGGPLGVTDE